MVCWGEKLFFPTSNQLPGTSLRSRSSAAPCGQSHPPHPVRLRGNPRRGRPTSLVWREKNWKKRVERGRFDLILPFFWRFFDHWYILFSGFVDWLSFFFQNIPRQVSFGSFGGFQQNHSNRVSSFGSLRMSFVPWTTTSSNPKPFKRIMHLRDLESIRVKSLRNLVGLLFLFSITFFR